MKTTEKAPTSLVAQYSAGLFSVLGSFGKGVPNSASVNFGLSGGANCERSCRHHPEHAHAIANPADACYAWILEKRHDRAQLRDKLARHERLPASIIAQRAHMELEREALYDKAPRPWIRFSTDGSLPSRKKAIRDSRFRAAFRRLIEFAVSRSGRDRIHLPVETAAKASFYREIVGDIVTVRESLQTPNMCADTIAAHRIPAGPVSFTAGENEPAGPNRRLRVLAAAAAAAAAWAQRTGRKTIVCPAVRVSFLSRLKAYRRGRSAEQIAEWRAGAKCGSCRACALAHVDVVYPAHGGAPLPIVQLT
jgi:hypothetical protein